MWTVVYIAPNRKIADNLMKLLAAEGILVNLRPSASAKAGAIEVLVPEVEVEEASEVLAKIVGN